MFCSLGGSVPDLLIHVMSGRFVLFCFLLFFVGADNLCSEDDATCTPKCTEAFGADSVSIAVVSDRSRLTTGSVFSFDDWVYVTCEIGPCWRNDFSIASFKSVVARPIPRQRTRATLLKKLREAETLTPKGDMAEFEVDEMGPPKRGFHFRIEKEVFDFREYKEQEDVSLEAKVVLNIVGSSSLPVAVEKTFHMRITASEPGERAVVHIYSPHADFAGLLSLPNAGKHQYEVVKDDRTARMYWYHYFGVARSAVTVPGFAAEKYAAVNHIMSQSHIGKKDRLTLTLRRRDSETSLFYPKTFLLGDDLEKAEFVSEVNENDDDQVWILKPSGFSEGRGMKFVSKIDDYLKIGEVEIDHLGQMFRHLEPETDYLAQRYIGNPLLYEGYKVGIRQFWLIASIEPLRVLVYDTGFCTFGSTLYENRDFDDLTIHLTNYDQQPDDKKPEFIYVKELADYMRENAEVGVNWYQDVFRTQVKNILTNVALSFNETILEGARSDIYTFALFGADFVMDQDHHLWLNEIQRSPSLRHTGECLKSMFMPEMIVETLNIVEEIRKFAERNGGSSMELKDLKSVNKFEWLIGN